MDNSQIGFNQFSIDNNRETYNSIPVVYCKHCLSLAIRTSGDYDYCDECGNTETEEALIEEWEELYEQKYKEKYLK